MDFFTNYPHLIEDGVNYWVTKYLQEWDMLGYVEMKPGRVVVYPSEIFHGAYHTKDIYYDIPRLTMVYAEVQRI